MKICPLSLATLRNLNSVFGTPMWSISRIYGKEREENQTAETRLPKTFRFWFHPFLHDQYCYLFVHAEHLPKLRQSTIRVQKHRTWVKIVSVICQRRASITLNTSPMRKYVGSCYRIFVSHWKQQLQLTECIVGYDKDAPVFANNDANIKIRGMLPCHVVFVEIQPNVLNVPQDLLNLVLLRQ